MPGLLAVLAPHGPTPIGVGVPFRPTVALGFSDASPHVLIAGVEYAVGRALGGGYILDDSVSVTLVADKNPSRASFIVKGFIPTVGQDVVIRLGWDAIFGGLILSVNQKFVGTPANYQCELEMIGYAWLLGQRKVNARYLSLSATAIGYALAGYAPAFTTAHIQAGLPVVDEITFTNEDVYACYTRLAKRFGGYCYEELKDIHLFTAESGRDPIPLTVSHDSLTGFGVTRDLGPVVTRVLSEGGGGTSLSAVAVGDTMIPITEPGWYAAAGGLVASGPQRISYTTKTQAAPTTPPTLALTGGGAVDTGSHDYAYTYVTAAGESLPSLLRSVTTQTTPLAPPVNAPTMTNSVGAGGALTAGLSYQWLVTYFTSGFAASHTNETTIGPAAAGVIAVAGQLVGMQLPPPPVGVVGLNIYRTVGGGSTFFCEYAGYVLPFPDVGSGTYIGFGAMDDATLVTQPGIPAANTASLGAVNISAIAVGPSGTTSRKVYRSAVGNSQLKLQQTIANNTATTGVQDVTADASLGANAPSTDTSALVLNAVSTTSGATATGATSLVLVSGAAFLSTGGWVIAAGLPVRYTGKSTNTLTGIPATGPGSISAALPSASTVTSCPTLSGIPTSGEGSIRYQILQGDDVNMIAQADDVAAQTALAAYLSSVLGIYSDGIQEDYLQDGRLTYTEALARATAQLALRRDVEVSIRYMCRDPLTRPGRTVHVDLPAPTSVNGDFKIQTVTISNFHPGSALFPDYTVVSAPTRFTLEDLLRMARLDPR